MKNKEHVYNDGLCRIVEEIKAPSSFSAKENGTKTTDFKTMYRLYFAEQSIREQDFEFAEARGRVLNRKIKTHLVSDINSQLNVIIGDMLYSIVNADIDRHNNEIYFYLEEVRKLVKT